jgi:hypothetical protein
VGPCWRILGVRETDGPCGKLRMIQITTSGRFVAAWRRTRCSRLQHSGRSGLTDDPRVLLASPSYRAPLIREKEIMIRLPRTATAGH